MNDDDDDDNDETVNTTRVAWGAASPFPIPKIRIRVGLGLAAPFGMAVRNRCEGCIVFSDRVTVCVIVCLSVNAITPEPLEPSHFLRASSHGRK